MSINARQILHDHGLAGEEASRLAAVRDLMNLAEDEATHQLVLRVLAELGVSEPEVRVAVLERDSTRKRHFMDVRGDTA